MNPMWSGKDDYDLMTKPLYTMDIRAKTTDLKLHKPSTQEKITKNKGKQTTPKLTKNCTKEKASAFQQVMQVIHILYHNILWRKRFQAIIYVERLPDHRNCLRGELVLTYLQHFEAWHNLHNWAMKLHQTGDKHSVHYFPILSREYHWASQEHDTHIVEHTLYIPHYSH